MSPRKMPGGTSSCSASGIRGIRISDWNERRPTSIYAGAGAVACPPDGGAGAWVINCQPADVPILVAARLLKPLGNPPPHSFKYFAALELLEQVEDRTWLAKVTNALNQHWQKRNAAKKNGESVLGMRQMPGAVSTT
jgi:hypothetical protein